MQGPFDQYKKDKPSVMAPTPGAPPELWDAWAAAWLDYYTQEPSPMTCLVPEIDADQEQNLKGKLAVLIGTGGTRKSYYAQNVVIQNVLGYARRWIYSGMEMGKPETVNRFLDMAVEPNEGEAFSKYLQRQARENKESVRSYLDLQKEYFGDNLILKSESGQTCADYERMIQEAIALFGSLDGLAIDGLSAMGGKGEETERYSQNTLELKELAKRYNIFILLICHTTKSAKQHTRDSREFVRGSEKILDNSDFSICFSNIINAHRSTPDNLEYINYLAHIKYYNKRGTGKMLNQLMEFSGPTKSFACSHAPISEYPDFETFSREYAAEKRKDDRRHNL